LTRLVALLAALAALLLGYQLYREHGRREAAEMQLGLDATRVLSAVFTRTQDLRVATLSGTAVARSDSAGLLFHPVQVTKAPYTVSYALKLGAIGRDRYRWSPDRRMLTVEIPDVTVEPSNIDMARAQVLQRGVWISRRAGVEMERQAAQRLAGKADDLARSDQWMAQARAAARAAFIATVRVPLAAADLGSVTVEARFPWESAAAGEPMDRSRSLKQVYGLSR
jgi:hypothetical protein